MQRCKLIEPLKFENGRATSPGELLVDGSGSAIPSFLVAPNARIQDLVNKNDTRLRIFSGTANPALAHVSVSIAYFFFTLFLFK